MAGVDRLVADPRAKAGTKAARGTITELQDDDAQARNSAEAPRVQKGKQIDIFAD